MTNIIRQFITGAGVTGKANTDVKVKLGCLRLEPELKLGSNENVSRKWELNIQN